MLHDEVIDLFEVLHWLFSAGDVPVLFVALFVAEEVAVLFAATPTKPSSLK